MFFCGEVLEAQACVKKCADVKTSILSFNVGEKVLLSDKDINLPLLQIVGLQTGFPLFSIDFGKPAQ
jgi:hypothetical protein